MEVNMYTGKVSEIMDVMKQYKDMFGETFPLMQTFGNAGETKKEIKRCLAENKPAVEIWPDKYGKCSGKYI